MREKYQAFIARFFDKTFLKFLLVGAVNTIFGTAIMFGAYNLLHLSYWISSAANYFFGSILSYFLNKHFTFRNREKGPGTVIRFALNISVCYLIAYGAAKPLARLILSGASQTARDNIAMFVGMGLFVVLNYIGQRFFAFAEKDRRSISGEERYMARIKKLNGSKRTVLVLAALVWLFMLALNLLTPFVADDFVYMVDLSTKKPLSCVLDIFPSMAVHAVRINGRLISHGLGQLFMLMPKAVFCAVNALVYTGFIWLLYRVASPEGKHSAILFAGIAMAFWYFVPVFGQVALWTIGSVNYLWALFFGLLYIAPYVRHFLTGEEPVRRTWLKVAFCVLAVPMGMYTEITSFVALFLAAALLLLSRLVHKRTLKTWLWVPVALAAVGYILLMAMPAELAAKKADGSLGGFAHNLGVALSMLKTHGTVPLCVCGAIFAVALLSGADADRLILSGLFACGALGGAIMPAVASYYPERCFCTTTALLILSAAVLVPELTRLGMERTMAAGFAVLAVLWTFSAVFGVSDVLRVHGRMEERTRLVEEQKRGGARVASVPIIVPETKYSALYGLQDLSADPDDFPNFHMAEWYGLEGIKPE